MSSVWIKLHQQSSITRMMNGRGGFNRVFNSSRFGGASFSLSQNKSLSTAPVKKSTLLTQEEGVHQTSKVSNRAWRNKPLFRRQGDVRFKTGLEASQLLVGEAKRRDIHEGPYISNVTSTLECLSPIFDRNPKYAFVAKQLMEPERLIQFRVAWIDDVGVVRLNRGFRLQYSSSLGSYEGPLHFDRSLTSGTLKAMGWDTIFSNAIVGGKDASSCLGAAVGGSDFFPLDKSDAELQRFCQSYMTELAKYIDTGMGDSPWMGIGVGPQEMGYLYGQYKRLHHNTLGRGGSGGGGRAFMSHNDSTFSEAPGLGIVYFAQEMLKDRGESLRDKKCLITGSGRVAQTVASKLLELGAIPLTFSDHGGHVYEPDGMHASQLKTIATIKQERGALLGRYIMSSTTAKFNDPENIFDVPCDLYFACGSVADDDNDKLTPPLVNTIHENIIHHLADKNKGFLGIIEGSPSLVTPQARMALRKRGLLYGPSIMTLTGSAIVHHLAAGLPPSVPIDQDMVQQQVKEIYQHVKHNAQEFNVRGDLFAGANLAGFLRVAHVMMAHGAV